MSATKSYLYLFGKKSFPIAPRVKSESWFKICPRRKEEDAKGKAGTCKSKQEVAAEQVQEQKVEEKPEQEPQPEQAKETTPANEWQSRQERRDNIRETLDFIISPPDENARKAKVANWKESHDMLATGQADAETVLSAANDYLKDYTSDWDLAESKLKEVGATDKELAKLSKVKERAQEKLGKKLEAYQSQVNKTYEISEQLEKAQAAEPELENEEDQKVVGKWKKEHAAWEKSAAKIEDNLQRERDKLEDKFNDLDEAIIDTDGEMTDAANDLASDIRNSVDKEEEDDPEPAEIEVENESQEETKSREVNEPKQKSKHVSKTSWKSKAIPEEFISARNKTTRAGYLSPLDPSDITNHNLILSEDGTVGAAVSSDGDIQNVFNNGGPKGAGTEAVLEAMDRGGQTLDCFDGFLQFFYTQFGFVETGRVKFNREYAPKKWDYEKDDTPDVVFMVLGKDVDDEETIRKRTNGPKAGWSKGDISDKYYDDWDKAKLDSRRTIADRSHGNISGKGMGGKTCSLDYRTGLLPGGIVKSLDTRHDYGCLMTVLSDPIRKEITDWTLENISDFHLGKGGREFRPHVTILYGFSQDDETVIQALKTMLKNHGPFSLKLGELKLFKSGYGKWKNEDGNVLYVEIDCPELHKLHEELVNSFPNEDKHPEYKPHLTLAYLLPEFSSLYEGMKSPFVGQTVVSNEVEYTGRENRTETIPLTFLHQEVKSIGSEFLKAIYEVEEAKSFPIVPKVKSDSWFKICPRRKEEDDKGKAGTCKSKQEVVAEQAEEQKVEKKPESIEQLSPEEDYKKNGVKSKAFKEWFGDWENDPTNASKIVDREGKPQVTERTTGEGKPIEVYHGTPNKFEEFSLDKTGSTTDAGYLGKGFYFTTDPETAEYYSKIRKTNESVVIPAYLSIKNPFNWGEKTFGARGLSYYGERLPEAIHDKVIERTGFVYDINQIDPDYNDEILISEAIRDELISQGYDGVISDVEGHKEIVAFEPNQIKAVNNQGTFDPKSNNINKSVKAMSWQDTNSGGALVPPPKQEGSTIALQRNGSVLPTDKPKIGTKSLKPPRIGPSKLIHTKAKTQGHYSGNRSRYFSECRRWPKGSPNAGACMPRKKKPKEDKRRKKKPKPFKPHKPRHEADNPRFRFKPIDFNEPGLGFALFPYKDRSFVKPASKMMLDDLVDFIEKNFDLLLADEKVFIGGWKDGNKDETHLEVTIVVPTEKEAIELCKEHGLDNYLDLDEMIVKEVNKEWATESKFFPIPPKVRQDKSWADCDRCLAGEAEKEGCHPGACKPKKTGSGSRQASPPSNQSNVQSAQNVPQITTGPPASRASRAPRVPKKVVRAEYCGPKGCEPTSSGYTAEQHKAVRGFVIDFSRVVTEYLDEFFAVPLTYQMLSDELNMGSVVKKDIIDSVFNGIVPDIGMIEDELHYNLRKFNANKLDESKNPSGRIREAAKKIHKAVNRLASAIGIDPSRKQEEHLERNVTNKLKEREVTPINIDISGTRIDIEVPEEQEIDALNVMEGEFQGWDIDWTVNGGKSLADYHKKGLNKNARQTDLLPSESKNYDGRGCNRVVPTVNEQGTIRRGERTVEKSLAADTGTNNEKGLNKLLKLKSFPIAPRVRQDKSYAHCRRRWPKGSTEGWPGACAPSGDPDIRKRKKPDKPTPKKPTPNKPTPKIKPDTSGKVKPVSGKVGELEPNIYNFAPEEIKPASKPADKTKPKKQVDSSGLKSHPESTDLAKKVHEKLHDHLQKHKNLTDKQKKAYSKALNDVLNRIHPEALKRVVKNTKRADFFPNADDLKEAMIAPYPNSARFEGKKIAGCYDMNRETLLLDGEAEVPSLEKGYTVHAPQHSYAHELGHAIDGPNRDISESKEWKKAWKEELSGGILTESAASKPMDGFAEFCRLVYAGTTSRDDIKKRFPKSVAVFEVRGIW